MTVPQFIESPRLELQRGWIFNIEPQYEVDIAEVGRFGEFANLFTRYPRIRIDVTIPPDKASDIPYIRRFYHITRGRAVPFRVRDPSDYLSTQDGFHIENDLNQPEPTDQPLVEIPGTPEGYQLVKQYRIPFDETELWIQERPIRKPVQGTIRVANDSGVEQPPETWALDYTTGILLPEPTFDGTPTSWGGEFDTPVRFDSQLPLRMEDWMLRSTSFVLLEKRYASGL